MLSNLSFDIWQAVAVQAALDAQDWCHLAQCCHFLKTVTASDIIWMYTFLSRKRPSVRVPIVSWRQEYMRRTLQSRTWRTTLSTCDTTDSLRRFARKYFNYKRVCRRQGFQVFVVDQTGKGDYKSIVAACKAAEAYDRILIKPGVYNEHVAVDKPLELVGDGHVKDVVLQGTHAPAVVCSKSCSRLANLTLKQVASSTAEMSASAYVSGGAQVVIEECLVTSAAGHCIVVTGQDTQASIRHNVIHEARGVGVLVCDGGTGTVEDNDIFANGRAGVAILRGANPLIRGNKIHEGKDSGVLVIENGRGKVEDNDIFSNGKAGVAILKQGSPVVKGNRIHRGEDSGVLVAQNGMGSVVDNDIFENRRAGVAIGRGGAPVVTGNKIHDGEGDSSLCISVTGKGIIKANHIHERLKSSIQVPLDMLEQVHRDNIIHTMVREILEQEREQEGVTVTPSTSDSMQPMEM